MYNHLKFFMAGALLFSGASFAADSNPKEIFVKDKISYGVEIESQFKDKPLAAILGSSRIKEGKVYDLASQIAESLAKQGYGILTGGGPGLMDAANKSATSAHAISLGFDVVSPWTRQPTTFMDKLFIFDDLQVRKRTMMRTASVLIFMPGGIGTLDEFFTMLGAMYSGQLPKKPIILVDRKYWQPLLGFVKSTLINDFKTAKQEDIDVVHLADTVKEVTALLPKR